MISMADVAQFAHRNGTEIGRQLDDKNEDND